MHRYRTLLSVLLGLVLLLQGYAVSAAPRAMLADVAGSETIAMADMPCHGQMTDPADQQLPSCCDVECPDMTSCALGHIAAATIPSMTLPQPVREALAFTPGRVASRTLTSPLRPPIAVHG